MFEHLSGLPRRVKVLIMLMGDVVLLPLALWSAVALRVGTFDPDVASYWWLFFVVPFVTVPIFIRIGLYRAVIRYLDDKIIYTVFYGVTLSVLLLMAVVMMGRAHSLPRSSVIIYWVIAVAYITSSRLLARGLMRSLEKFSDDHRQPVAIYGAGRAGLQTAIALMSGVEYRPVAFFDDKKDLQGSNVAGIRVHPPKDALQIMANEKCRQLLIAMPSSTRARRREIIQAFEGKDLILKTLPGMGDLVDGRVRVEDMREVGVEDLLGRDPVPPDEQLISACIKNKVVMVTGAGGSIGSELCRKITTYSPTKLVLFEQSEYALYRIEQELHRRHHYLKIISVLGDVLNTEQLSRVMDEHSVETVYHAAAYKHVPLVEENTIAGIMNNAFGTYSAARAAIKNNVSNFVLISTDKAVRSTNVMGCSKRLAELILQAIVSESSDLKTKFCMVRFGNVLASSGSVVPLFREQIRSGGPVTVTHPDVTRYFMTIPEAAELVLQAGTLSVGGDVFVLDMGEPIKIVYLAQRMIELSGLTVRDPVKGTGDVTIEFVGLRPGEKLYEELLIGDCAESTTHPRIMKAHEQFLPADILMPKLELMHEYCVQGDGIKAKALLKELVESTY